MNETHFNRLLIASLTILFFALRGFTDTAYYFVGFADEASFFRLAENFPAHRLYGDGLYVIHPPIYFYALRMLNLFGTDYHVAGLLLSLVAAFAFWIVVVQTVRMFLRTQSGIAIALLYIAVLNLCVSQMGSISREPFIMALSWGAIFFYLRWLRNDNLSLWPSGLLAVVTAWTTDLAVLLIPTFILCWIFFGERKHWKQTMLLVGLACVAYSLWLGARAYTYSTHDYFPAGIDGTIEYTRTYSLAALFNPNFLPETYSIVHSFLPSPGITLSGIPSLYLNPFWNPRSILLILMALLVGAGNVLAWYRTGWRNTVFCFSILSVLLLSPLLLGQWPRYGLLGVLPVAIVLGAAVDELCVSLVSIHSLRFIAHAVLVSCWILSIIWIAGHPIFTLNTEMKVEGTAVAAILNKLPGEPVMAPVGLPPELAFLTKKQMLALPVSPSKLEPMVGKFGVKYIVVPKFSTEGMTPQLRHARAVDTIDKLIQMPDKFARISDVDETFMISFNWQQRTAWNPTRPAAIETTNYRMIHGYSIYRVLQN